MNRELLTQLIHWPKPYISGTNLQSLLGKSRASRQGILKRAVKAEDLIRIKRDLYLISNKICSKKLDLFEFAQLIYGPSYISVESALRFYQWIPEAVYTVTSVCFKPSKTFNTPVAYFSFERIRPKIYFVGLKHYQREQASFFIAEPWKALADFIYLRKKSWDNVDGLVMDMRIEPETLLQSDLRLLDDLCKQYPCQRTRQVLSTLHKVLK